MKNILTFLAVYFFFLQINAQQLSKVYVLSEGSFSAGSSKLSLYDVQLNNFTLNIFSPGNIGLYPDGLIYYDGYLYLTEQGSFGSSGKIYKLDTLGNVINSAIVGTNPYSLAIANNKIYITNGPASQVSVLNISDFSLIKNIQVGVYPQEIIAFNNKVFVANNSVWGGNSDSTVSVIDPILDSVIASITLQKDPSSFAISNDGYLLVGCPGDHQVGKIFKVDASTYQKIDVYNIPQYGFSKDISVDKNSSNIYFISYSNHIVKYNLIERSSTNIVSSTYPNNYYYGYAFDYSSKKHFILDAKNFTVNGSVIITDSLYNVINNFTTGIAPRRILFKYNSNPSSIHNDILVTEFSLEQNYPNPFNPSTKISWSMPYGGQTSLKVFDVLGNEIIELVNEYKPAGNYTVDFNANNLSSGVYLYTLNINNGTKRFTSTKKMTLIK